MSQRTITIDGLSWTSTNGTWTATRTVHDGMVLHIDIATTGGWTIDEGTPRYRLSLDELYDDQDLDLLVLMERTDALPVRHKPAPEPV